MDQTRPGQRELFGKVETALAAFKAGQYMIGAPYHLASDLAEVGIDSAADFWALLPQLLGELSAAGPAACYAGWRPVPEAAGEPLVKGLKLWAFVWESRQLGCEVYLKFCLKESKSGATHYAHVRIHKNRTPN